MIVYNQGKLMEDTSNFLKEISLKMIF